MRDPRQERREKLDPSSARPAIGTGINTVPNSPAIQNSLIPGSADPRDHRNDPRNGMSFRSPDPKYGIPYDDNAEEVVSDAVRNIDPTRVARSSMMQKDVPGRLMNAVPVDMRPFSPTGNEADAMESARLAMYPANKGEPAGGMGMDNGGMPAHNDAALYADANEGKGFIPTMSVDSGQLVPGQLKQVIRKGNKRGIA